LRDLITLREIRVEVVLPGEDGVGRDLAAECEAELHRPLDRSAVDHGQRSGETEADGARVRVLPRTEARLAAAEHLRLRLELHVDLEPDDRVPAGAHRSRSGTPSKPIACSSAWPAWKRVFSPNWRPISCKPTGSPSESPDGMLSPGNPARQEGIVITSH